MTSWWKLKRSKLKIRNRNKNLKQEFCWQPGSNHIPWQNSNVTLIRTNPSNSWAFENLVATTYVVDWFRTDQNFNRNHEINQESHVYFREILDKFPSFTFWNFWNFKSDIGKFIPIFPQNHEITSTNFAFVAAYYKGQHKTPPEEVEKINGKLLRLVIFYAHFFSWIQVFLLQKGMVFYVSPESICNHFDCNFFHHFFHGKCNKSQIKSYWNV